MKQILGKILIIVFLEIVLFGNVEVSVDNPAIYKGDNLSFTIKAKGDNVKFPEIYDIEGNPILGTSSSQSTSIINGVVSKDISKTYTFSPTKSLTIPKFEVIIDGKKYKTDEIKVSVLKPSASVNGANFVLELKTNKKEAYVGEKIVLSIIFKRKLNARADKLQLSEPKLENFWVKKDNRVKRSAEGEYVVQKLNYILTPQKEGNYTINSMVAKIGTIVRRIGGGGIFNDPFFGSFGTDIRWKKIFSNELNIKVKSLPNNLEVYGQFQIEATVDKKQVKSNKPVNLTIKIKGEGNIDDIKKFNLDIGDLILYSDEPKIKNGEFTQKIAIISDKSYTIPPIKLDFFDKHLKKVVTTQTSPINIKVLGGNKTTQPPSIEVSKELNSKKITTPQKIVIKEEKSFIKYLFLIFGLIFGFGFSIFLQKFKEQKIKNEIEITKAIKKTKSNKELFKLLLPHSKKSPIISNILKQLEENIYQNGKNKIDKGKLIEFFEEYHSK